jgi:hypothetical protein
VQAIQGLLPQTAIDEVVPLRDQVVDRAPAGHAADQLSRMTKRDTAVHAARALGAEFLLLHVVVKLFPVFHPLGRRAIDGQFAQVFDEASWFTHGSWRI